MNSRRPRRSAPRSRQGPPPVIFVYSQTLYLTEIMRALDPCAPRRRCLLKVRPGQKAPDRHKMSALLRRHIALAVSVFTICASKQAWNCGRAERAPTPSSQRTKAMVNPTADRRKPDTRAPTRRAELTREGAEAPQWLGVRLHARSSTTPAAFGTQRRNGVESRLSLAGVDTLLSQDRLRIRGGGAT